MTSDDRGLFNRLESLARLLAAGDNSDDRSQHGVGRFEYRAGRVEYGYSVSIGIAGDDQPSGRSQSRQSPDGKAATDYDEPHAEVRVSGDELHVVGILPETVDCDARLDRENEAIVLSSGVETIERIALDGQDTPITEAGTLVDDAAIVDVSRNNQFFCVQLARTGDDG
jgi:hypothetical protein